MCIRDRIRPGHENQAKQIFSKWDLDFAVIGNTIKENKLLIKFQKKIVTDLPLKCLADQAPQSPASACTRALTPRQLHFDTPLFTSFKTERWLPELCWVLAAPLGSVHCDKD